MYNKTVDSIASFYPDVDKREILLTWNKGRMRVLFLMGYAYCSNCVYMIKTDEINCEFCNKKFRRTVRSKAWRKKDE